MAGTPLGIDGGRNHTLSFGLESWRGGLAVGEGSGRVAQIGCYMTDDEIGALDEYAKSMEVTRAAVCSLVIQRELRVRQLSRISRHPRSPDDDETRRRVTVHVRNPELKCAFTRHVRSLGFGSDQAAFALFMMELRERWLFKTFGFLGNQG
jgi:hypothetical protein